MQVRICLLSALNLFQLLSTMESRMLSLGPSRGDVPYPLVFSLWRRTICWGWMEDDLVDV